MNATGTIIVNTLPTASITTNNSPQCSGSNATFNLSGTSGAIVTYNINGATNTTVTLTGGTASVTVINATSNQILNLVSVTNPTTTCSTTLSGSSTVTVNPNVTPTFTQVTSICSGDTFMLPTTSTNSITGTWTPAIDNTTTTTYTFTPTSGQCASTATMTVTVGTVKTWSGSSWSPSAPTSIDSAVISGNYSENDDLTACSLLINNGAIVSIPTGKNVTLNNEVTVTGVGSTFTIESNSNLLQNSSTAVNSGIVKVIRTTSPLMRLDYVLWSSPVDGQTLNSFSPSTLSDRFYTYNPTSNTYVAVGAANVATTNFAAGTGYLIRMPNTHPTTATPWTGTFFGTLHNGDYSVSTTSGEFNAVGNPYPSAIDADAFIANNSLTDAIYFWRKTNAATGSSYATYTTAGGTTPSPGTSASPTSAIPNGIIQVGQGFIAKATSGTLNFNNGQRIIDNNNQFFRLNNDRSRIWLNLTTSDGIFSQAMIAYMPTATNGVDAAIDGRPLQNNATELTSIINNEGFVIQGRAPFVSTDVVPLQLKAATAGNYTIAIDHVDGLFTTNQTIYLRDNSTGTIHNLNSSSYSFNTASGTFNSRFEILYQLPLSYSNPLFNANQVIIYKNTENNFIINTGTIQMNSVKVFDIRGRLLMEQKGITTNQTSFNVGTTNEVLLVQIVSLEGLIVTKKVIN